MGSKLHQSRHDPPLNDRQKRWIESLAPFSYTFEWIKGADNTVADALSRNPAACCIVTVTHALLAGLRKRLQLIITDDQEYQMLLEKAKDPASPLDVWKGLVVDEGGRIVMPKDDEIRTLVLAEAHDSPLAGHFGIEKTLEIVQRTMDLEGTTERRERVCPVLCAMSKIQEFHAQASWRTPSHFGYQTLGDPDIGFCVGTTSPIPARNIHQILVMVDKFTKYVMLEPCPKEVSAEDTAQIFVKRVVRDHGVPSVVISDRGPQFAAQVWKSILKKSGGSGALSPQHTIRKQMANPKE